MHKGQKPSSPKRNVPSSGPFIADNTSEIKSLFVTVFKDIPLRSTYKPHQNKNTVRPEEIIFSFALRPFFERNLLPPFHLECPKHPQ